MNWKLQADHLEIYYWSRQLCEPKLGRICHFSWFALLIFSAESRRLSSDGSSDISSTWHRMISSSISSTIILTNHSATVTSNFSLFFSSYGDKCNTPRETGYMHCLYKGRLRFQIIRFRIQYHLFTSETLRKSEKVWREKGEWTVVINSWIYRRGFGSIRRMRSWLCITSAGNVPGSQSPSQL